MNKNINFTVSQELLELAYQGDKQALLEIARKAEREQRLGLAENFFRLAGEARTHESCHTAA